ncbi:MAG: hypothetical protein WBE96_22300, partial [Pseudolabrys sp.]
MLRKRGASQFIGLNRHRATATDLKSRLAERDRRQLADNRTPAQKWLNDPPADRSALSQGLQQQAPGGRKMFDKPSIG